MPTFRKRKFIFGKKKKEKLTTSNVWQRNSIILINIKSLNKFFSKNLKFGRMCRNSRGKEFSLRMTRRRQKGIRGLKIEIQIFAWNVHFVQIWFVLDRRRVHKSIDRLINQIFVFAYRDLIIYYRQRPPNLEFFTIKFFARKKKKKLWPSPFFFFGNLTQLLTRRFNLIPEGRKRMCVSILKHIFWCIFFFLKPITWVFREQKRTPIHLLPPPLNPHLRPLEVPRF